MAGTLSKLGALTRRHPDRAKKQILTSAEELGGNSEQMAAALGVSTATLWRCQKVLGIFDDVKNIQLDAAIK